MNAHAEFGYGFGMENYFILRSMERVHSGQTLSSEYGIGYSISV
jgi:hypothetical protein